jgi:hypothetical protein
MTEKQIAKIEEKIKHYKKLLAADKRFWGGQYHDGQGIRFAIPEQYIKIKDYKGGLKYLNWYNKNFPDCAGYPLFLFEWTFILFKCDKLEEAELKAHRTFFSNTYLFDRFLGNELKQLDKNISSNWELDYIIKSFKYKKENSEFSEFAIWLETILNTTTFLNKVAEFVEIESQLKKEPVGPKRSDLVDRLHKIKYV